MAGWRYGSDGRPEPRVIAHSGDALATTQALNDVMTEFGHQARYIPGDDGDPGVWLVERGDPVALGCWLMPGQQVVVEGNGQWRIESIPAVAS